MENKIILQKKNGLGLFLFRAESKDLAGFDEVQFVVATLTDEDKELPIGSAVERWINGAYFGVDLSKATKCFMQSTADTQ